jgi:hypothetical protein
LEVIVPLLTPVQEKSLKLLFDFGVVTQSQILLTDGGYIYVFHLRTKENVAAMHGQKVTNLLLLSAPLSDVREDELFSLYGTQKLRPRTWKSMDRMIRWFSERGLMPPSVSLQITAPVSVQLSTTTRSST